MDRALQLMCTSYAQIDRGGLRLTAEGCRLPWLASQFFVGSAPLAPRGAFLRPPVEDMAAGQQESEFCEDV